MAASLRLRRAAWTPASVKEQPSHHVPGHWLSHLSVQRWLRLDGWYRPVLSCGCNFVFAESPSWLLSQDGEQRLPQPRPVALGGTFGCVTGCLSILTTQLSLSLLHLTGF